MSSEVESEPDLPKHGSAGTWYVGLGLAASVIGFPFLLWETLAKLVGLPELSTPPLSAGGLLLAWVTLGVSFCKFVGVAFFSYPSWWASMFSLGGSALAFTVFWTGELRSLPHPTLAMVVATLVPAIPVCWVYFCWIRYFMRRRADFGVMLWWD